MDFEQKLVSWVRANTELQLADKYLQGSRLRSTAYTIFMITNLENAGVSRNELEVLRPSELNELYNSRMNTNMTQELFLETMRYQFAHPLKARKSGIDVGKRAKQSRPRKIAQGASPQVDDSDETQSMGSSEDVLEEESEQFKIIKSSFCKALEKFAEGKIRHVLVFNSTSKYILEFKAGAYRLRNLTNIGQDYVLDLSSRDLKHPASFGCRKAFSQLQMVLGDTVALYVQAGGDRLLLETQGWNSMSDIPTSTQQSTCWGCIGNQPNQEAHMGRGGCLYQGDL